MNHIVDMCILTEFESGLKLLHKADDEAVICWNHQQQQHSRNEQ